MATPLCLVRGSINVDEFFHVPHIVRPGETISSTYFERRPGGKGANQAVSVARGGGKAAMAGALGKDGVWVRDKLADSGVDTSSLKIEEELPSGRATIQLSAEGENSIVLVAGANYTTTLSSPPSVFSSACSKPTHLLLQNEIPLSDTRAFLEFAAAKGSSCLSIMNPAPMLRPEQIKEFPWEKLDVLIVNEGEADDLLNGLNAPHPPPSSSSAADEADIRLERFDLLGDKFGKTRALIITLGKEGVVARMRCTGEEEGAEGATKRFRLPAAKGVKVKDTTGAGDCFTGYFVAQLMLLTPNPSSLPTPKQARQALRMSTLAAGICVARQGAMESVPTLEEVGRRLAAEQMDI